MTQTLYLLLALSVGMGSAVQTGMIASLGRSRGPMEAAWISLLATLCGLSLAFALRSLKGNPPSLPSPLDGVLIFTAASTLAGLALFTSVRGLNSYLALTGLFGFAYLVGVGFLAPRLGIALFGAAATAGTLLASVGLDHVGAFGADINRVNVLRGLGVVSLICGVVLVRFSR